MSDGLLTIARCPYCSRVVAVDPVGIVNPGRAGRVRCFPEGVDFVVFDPDRPPAGHCPHLVQLGVEAEWEGREECREVVIRHPALEAADPSHDLTHFLWSVMLAPREEFAFNTSVDFVNEDIEGMVLDRRGRPHWQWWGCFDALYAADAVKFIEESLAQYIRIDGPKFKPDSAG